MTLNVHIERIMAASAIVGTFGLAAWGGSAIASADPQGMIALTDVWTVDGTDYPECVEEDCSDQPNQVGVWMDSDTGNWYLELGEVCTGEIPAVCDLRTYLINDDTTTDQIVGWGDDSGYDAGYEN